MNTPTYKEQFDKITRAYINGEIEPLDNCACFIGNLLNGNGTWSCARYHHSAFTWRYSILPESRNYSQQSIDMESNGFYSIEEICNMEENFLKIYDEGFSRTETSLFYAMESTLEMLKAIHESKGEIVDPIPFAKRQLAC